MELSSPLFWTILFLASIILYFRLKKNKPPIVSRDRFITLKGEKLVTEINLHTPLPCLLAEGLIFGENYANKEMPTLPHGDNCKCRLIEEVKTSDKILAEKSITNQSFETDVGLLSDKEKRFYKYNLVINHPTATEQQKKDFQELVERISLSESQKTKILNHIKNN